MDQSIVQSSHSGAAQVQQRSQGPPALFPDVDHVTHSAPQLLPSQSYSPVAQRPAGGAEVAQTVLPLVRDPHHVGARSGLAQTSGDVAPTSGVAGGMHPQALEFVECEADADSDADAHSAAQAQQDARRAADVSSLMAQIEANQHIARYILEAGLSMSRIAQVWPLDDLRVVAGQSPWHVAVRVVDRHAAKRDKGIARRERLGILRRNDRVRSGSTAGEADAAPSLLYMHQRRAVQLETQAAILARELPELREVVSEVYERADAEAARLIESYGVGLGRTDGTGDGNQTGSARVALDRWTKNYRHVVKDLDKQAVITLSRVISCRPVVQGSGPEAEAGRREVEELTAKLREIQAQITALPYDVGHHDIRGLYGAIYKPGDAAPGDYIPRYWGDGEDQRRSGNGDRRWSGGSARTWAQPAAGGGGGQPLHHPSGGASTQGPFPASAWVSEQRDFSGGHSGGFGVSNMRSTGPHAPVVNVAVPAQLWQNNGASAGVPPSGNVGGSYPGVATGVGGVPSANGQMRQGGAFGGAANGPVSGAFHPPGPAPAVAQVGFVGQTGSPVQQAGIAGAAPLALPSNNWSAPGSGSGHAGGTAHAAACVQRGTWGGPPLR